MKDKVRIEKAEKLNKTMLSVPKEDRTAGPPTQDIPSPLKDKTKLPFYCCIPFTMLFSTEMGDYAACNFAVPSSQFTPEGDRIKGTPGKDGQNVVNTTVEDWMTKSDYMNKLRKEMVDPNSPREWTKKVCDKCIYDEDKHGSSRRLNVTGRYSRDPDFWPLIERATQKFKDTGQYNFTDRVLEAQLKIFGTECNLDCFMCMPFSSDMRQKNTYVEGREFHPTVWDKKEVMKVRSIRANKIYDPAIIDQLAEIAPYIRTLKLIGGEPLIMKKQYELLDYLVSSGHAKHMHIKYQTNLTKTAHGDHNIFDYIPKFKLVNVVVSIDGVGKYNDYLRRRSSYKEILDNIDMMLRYRNVLVDMNAMVTMPGVLRLYELFEVYKNRPEINDMNWWMIFDPYSMRVHHMPQELKDMVKPYYQKYPEAHDIVTALERRREDDSDLHFNSTIKYLLDRDKHYEGTKWEMHLFDVFPELERFYDPLKAGKSETLNSIDDWRNWEYN